MRDLYEILDIDSFATQQEIKEAYRKLALEYHPDRNNGSKESEHLFKEVALAYRVLSDERKRRQYDLYGEVEGESIDHNVITEKFMKQHPAGETDEEKRSSNYKKVIKRVRNMAGEYIYRKCFNCMGTGIFKKEEGFFIVENTCSVCDGEGFILIKKEPPEPYSPHEAVQSKPLVWDLFSKEFWFGSQR